MVNYFKLFSLYGPLLGRVIPKFLPFRYNCDINRDKHALPVFKFKGHWVTYLHFSLYDYLYFFRIMTLIRASDPKISAFRSISNGYRDKRPLPVFKVKGDPVTYLHFFRFMTLIRASVPQILSVWLFLRRLPR